MLTPRLHSSMYFLARRELAQRLHQVALRNVERRGGSEVLSSKSCSWHLGGNRESDQQRNLKVAPLSRRCSWCWRPPATMCTVRRPFVGIWVEETVGGALFASDMGLFHRHRLGFEALPLGGSTWYQMLLECKS